MQTLGGSGTVRGNVVIDAGAHLSPGDAPSLVGTLSFTGNVSLTGGSILDFDLPALGASDTIAMPASTLTLYGQQFSDFNFFTADTFGPGVYTLVDAYSIQGSLGLITDGYIAGKSASLSVAGGDLVLTVTPEPSTLALLAFGTIAALAYASRRRNP